MIYQDFTKPLQKPQVEDIVSAAPEQSPAPTANDASYSVPASHPKYLKIQDIDIDTQVRSVNLTDSGAIDAPKTAREVGWYQNSAFPGSGRGAVFIDGHVNDSLNNPGVFFRLAELTEGSNITIVRGDDTHIAYKVESIERQPLDQVDVRALLTPIDPAREGLTLITCGGIYDKERATFTERVVVRGVRQ